MRYTIPGLLMLAAVVWMAFEARSTDSYYFPEHVTRWEHASNAGSAPAVVGGSVVASFIALVFLCSGAFGRRLGPLATLVGSTTYLFALAVAWVALAGGH
jgi:hypothetical protein